MEYPFAIKKTTMIPTMSSIMNLKVQLGDKVVYEGKGILKQFYETRESFVLRINLTTDTFDLEKFVGMRLEERIKDEELVNNIFQM
jgi:hypothetical protein